MPIRSRIQSIIRFLGATLLGVSVALLLAFNALLLWVATGPRNIDMLSPFIEVALTDPAHTYSVNIGESWLIWDGWKHPIDIRLKNVSVYTKERQRFSRFPEISLGLDVPSLLVGAVLPSSLTIVHPVLSLYQHDDRSISFGFRPEVDEGAAPQEPKAESPPAEVPAIPFEMVLAHLVEPDAGSSLRKLRTVTILNADISVGNTHSGVFFTATDANLVFKSNRKGAQAFGSAKLTYGENESLVEANFTLPRKEPLILGEVSFGPIMPGTLSDLFTHKTELSALKLPLRGRTKMQMDRAGNLQTMSFQMEGGKGTVETERLAAVLPVTSLKLEGEMNGRHVRVSKLLMDMDGMLIEAEAEADIDGENTAIKAHGLALNIPNDNLRMLWPLGVA
ncbi:MAG: hypothetical protein K2Q01_08015, partial [Rickettsiales bacterium]|nr:hypothetical protein [Rickettsiales bacterium]